MDRTKVFVSYSHRDWTWLERLKVHLALLQRRGVVHVWSDTRIEVGAQWRDEIEAALTESRVAVLLITPDFLASEFVWNEEMPKILAHKEEGMLLLPLIASHAPGVSRPNLLHCRRGR
jgi:predicted nucleotide-binding protein